MEFHHPQAGQELRGEAGKVVRIVVLRLFFGVLLLAFVSSTIFFFSFSTKPIFCLKIQRLCHQTTQLQSRTTLVESALHAVLNNVVFG